MLYVESHNIILLLVSGLDSFWYLTFKLLLLPYIIEISYKL